MPKQDFLVAWPGQSL